MIRHARPDEAAPYLRGLNACFPGWGDAATFDWCFRRRAGGPGADLLVVERGGALLAGSAVIYRRATRAGRAPETLGCMTGSWTLPEARRQGWFAALTEASAQRAAERGCTLLVAWAAATNGSTGTLLRLSSRIVETAYLTAPADADGASVSEIPAAEVESAFRRRVLPSEYSYLVYTASEWTGQMIRRPRPTKSIRLSDGTVALIGEAPARDVLLDVSGIGTDTLLNCAEKAAAYGRRRGRRLHLYTADPATMAAAGSRGFESRPGYFYQIELVPSTPAGAERWWFSDGDRM